MASKIIATIILIAFLGLSFIKNIGAFEQDKPVLIFSIIDLLMLVFVGLVVWGVL